VRRSQSLGDERGLEDEACCARGRSIVVMTALTFPASTGLNHVVEKLNELQLSSGVDISDEIQTFLLLGARSFNCPVWGRSGCGRFEIARKWLQDCCLQRLRLEVYQLAFHLLHHPFFGSHCQPTASTPTILKRCYQVVSVQAARESINANKLALAMSLLDHR
jgi:hypothetical protein